MPLAFAACTGCCAERDTREAIEGVPHRREFQCVECFSDFTAGNMTVSRVQA